MGVQLQVLEYDTESRYSILVRGTPTTSTGTVYQITSKHSIST
jgi:hypothetical protein